MATDPSRPKIDRDGHVSVRGQRVGRVERHEDRENVMSGRICTGWIVRQRWRARDVAGEIVGPLCGFRTRGDAVDALVREAAATLAAAPPVPPGGKLRRVVDVAESGVRMPPCAWPQKKPCSERVAAGVLMQPHHKYKDYFCARHHRRWLKLAPMERYRVYLGHYAGAGPDANRFGRSDEREAEIDVEIARRQGAAGGKRKRRPAWRAM